MITVVVSSASADSPPRLKTLGTVTVSKDEIIDSDSEDLVPILHSFAQRIHGATLEERLIETLPCWNAYIVLELQDHSTGRFPGSYSSPTEPAKPTSGNSSATPSSRPTGSQPRTSSCASRTTG